MADGHRLIQMAPGKGGARFIFVHPVTGLLSCYAYYLRALSGLGSAHGFAPTDDAPSDTKRALSVRALAERYSRSLPPAENVEFLVLVGWRTGADIVLEMTANLQPVAGRLLAILIDPTYDFARHALFIDMAKGMAAHDALWKHFAATLTNDDLARTIIAQRDFSALDSDADRVNYIYRVRHEALDLPPLRNPFQAPGDQFRFFHRLMFDTHHDAVVARPTARHSECPVLLVARQRDESAANAFAAGLSPRRTTVMIPADGRFDVLSATSAAQVAAFVESHGPLTASSSL